MSEIVHIPSEFGSLQSMQYNPFCTDAVYTQMLSPNMFIFSSEETDSFSKWMDISFVIL